MINKRWVDCAAHFRRPLLGVGRVQGLGHVGAPLIEPVNPDLVLVEPADGIGDAEKPYPEAVGVFRRSQAVSPGRAAALQERMELVGKVHHHEGLTACPHVELGEQVHVRRTVAGE